MSTMFTCYLIKLRHVVNNGKIYIYIFFSSALSLHLLVVIVKVVSVQQIHYFKHV